MNLPSKKNQQTHLKDPYKQSNVHGVNLNSQRNTGRDTERKEREKREKEMKLQLAGVDNTLRVISVKVSPENIQGESLLW